MVWHKLLSKQRRRAVVACFRMTPLYNIPRSGSSQDSYRLFQNHWDVYSVPVWLCRHRASNMFLEGYKRNWLYTEGYAFEDRMIDDLSVSGISHPHSFICTSFGTIDDLHTAYASRKPWSKRKEMRKKRKKQSQTPCTSSFCISVAPLWPKKGWLFPHWCVAELEITFYFLRNNCLTLSNIQ